MAFGKPVLVFKFEVYEKLLKHVLKRFGDPYSRTWKNQSIAGLVSWNRVCSFCISWVSMWGDHKENIPEFSMDYCIFMWSCMSKTVHFSDSVLASKPRVITGDAEMCWVKDRLRFVMMGNHVMSRLAHCATWIWFCWNLHNLRRQCYHCTTRHLSLWYV